MCVYFSRDLETVAPDGKSETHGCFQIIHPLKNKQLLSFWHLFFFAPRFWQPSLLLFDKIEFLHVVSGRRLQGIRTGQSRVSEVSVVTGC